MCCSALGVSLLVGSAAATSTDLNFGEKTVLVFENRTGGDDHQFVLRLARFHPDIYLEWESFNHQGTVHLYRKAVSGAKRVTVGGLFEAGLDIESKDTMTNWLPTKVYQQVVEKGEAKVQLNNQNLKLRFVEEGVHVVTVDKVDVEVPVVHLEDDRKGKWIVHRNPQNPVLLEYESAYYQMQLKRVSTSKSNNLRWIKKLPPIK